MAVADSETAAPGFEAAPDQVVGILLAAGAGSRFGGRKLLEPLADGTPVGLASLRNLKAALGAVVAVVRDGDEELRRTLQDGGAQVVSSRDAWKGMGHSLADAVRASSHATGWVVALGDMPAIAPATIAAVASELQRCAAIVVPVFAGERGHPVGFPAALRDELLKLEGDEGARSLLRREADRIVKIAVEDPGTQQDIDTRADLHAMARGPDCL